MQMGLVWGGFGFGADFWCSGNGTAVHLELIPAVQLEAIPAVGGWGRTWMLTHTEDGRTG